jgi:hypothetical protein
MRRLASVLLFLLGIGILLLLATPTVLVDVWRLATLR